MLARADSIGPMLGRGLIDHFGSATRVLSRSSRGLQTCPGVGPVVSESIVRLQQDQASAAYAARQLSFAEELGAEYIPLSSDRYPELLREIVDPPLLLWKLGQLPVLPRSLVAVVGTRRPTPYGINVAETISAGLAARGIGVVSGLASGIDTSAHEGALTGGGPTIAVLGSGLQTIYPPTNLKLARQIENAGCLLSEFDFEEIPHAKNFPQRNRIISGLSLGTLVVEAFESGGALITAKLALDQNREVFAIPSPLGRPSGEGSNALIADGTAKLITGVQDILDELSITPASIVREQKRSKIPSSLPEVESQILTVLLAEGTATLDLLIRHTGLRLPQLMSTLTHLECRRLIRRFPGKLFTLR